jgi:hypothetical protein
LSCKETGSGDHIRLFRDRAARHTLLRGAGTMQTPIAQAAALTIFGNDTLRGRLHEEFWPGSTVFTFCKTVNFVNPESATNREMVFAENPIQWISKLKHAGTTGLRLHHVLLNDPNLPERVSVGFVGGRGRWLIETLQPAQSDLWEPRWLIGNRNDPDRRIWNASYHRIGNASGHLPLQKKELSALKGDLKLALARIEIFAHSQKLENFATAFRTTIDVLESKAPLSATYHTDLARSFSVPLKARQLLAAAQLAWVFGGMGTWNDLGFLGKDQQEYDAVTADLFNLLIQAICQSVNSSTFEGSSPGGFTRSP